MKVDLTSTAAAELQRLLRARGLPDEAGVLISVKGGGCQGFTYVIDLLRAPLPDWTVLESAGVRLFTDPATVVHLVDMVIDFIEDELNRGFVFRNPTAKSTCGCGSSFST